MPIYDLFSKKQKIARGEMPDVFQYKTLPHEFRVQVVHILRDALGIPKGYDNAVKDVFKVIHDLLCREYGLFGLTDDVQNGDYVSSVYNFFLQTDSVEHALDVIQISFRLVNNLGKDYDYRIRAQPSMEPDDAINELNIRFREHGIGYQFESGEIIRVDS